MKISIANSRFATSWRNEDLSWEQLKERLANTTRTPESVAEYRSMPKMSQDKIKDVGGFVGGWLKDGKRRSDAVLCRSLLTLDLDFAKIDFWEYFVLFNDLAAICYSTHKHTPSAPRLRLLMPLNRDVTPEEYEAIARKLAEELGIDQFDDTTYQASRLMYWPSTSQDGQYFFQTQDGPSLDADVYLSKYADWRDVTIWPVSSRQTDQLRKHAAKAEDPLKKEGVIGAFCQAYTIQEAIDAFLPDIYRSNPRGDRYTFIGGSTANGLVVYDDKYAFSNHATDPASGRLCNAFDLVRIHKFGNLDQELSEANQAISKRPSFKAMSEWVTTLEKVKTELLGAKGNDAWKQNFDTNKKGVPQLTINNFTLILQNDEGLKNRLKFNELSHQPEASPALPWGREGQLEEGDDAQFRKYIEKNYHLYNAGKLNDAVVCESKDHRYHPIRQYLESLPPWDSVPRVDRLLIDYLGAQNTAYVREVTRKTLVGAVARIFEPGCKFDYMLTLIGRPGIGKSTLGRVLGGDWYIGLEHGLAGKESVEQMAGRWIVELEELASLKKAEVEQIKSYISKQEEQVRMAYAHRSESFKRQNVFIGTTNNRDFLRDLTGNRRFWCVDVAGSDNYLPNPDDVIARESFRGPIWAEALALYRAGETRYLSREMEVVANAIQEAHMEDDPWLGLIADYLERPLPDKWNSMELFDRRTYLAGDCKGTVTRSRVCALEIWCECIGNNLNSLSAYESGRINMMLEKLGWCRYDGVKKFGKLYGAQRGFYRP